MAKIIGQLDYLDSNTAVETSSVRIRYKNPHELAAHNA
jgi:hypothetical protein